MERDDPEMRKLVIAENELEEKTAGTVERFHRAAKDDREKIKAELQKLVSEQFDLRQKRRAVEMKRLEEQLQRMRDAAERREKGRKQIIERRVSELLEQEEEPSF
jgi:hypothetical protein